MADPKSLIASGMDIIGREMERLNNDSVAGKLEAGQREDLCAYMTLLRNLVGKDIAESSDNFAHMSEEEIIEEIEKLKNAGQDTPTQGRNSPRKRKNK